MIGSSNLDTKDMDKELSVRLGLYMKNNVKMRSQKVLISGTIKATVLEQIIMPAIFAFSLNPGFTVSSSHTDNHTHIPTHSHPHDHTHSFNEKGY